ncbi:hypothetical protein [Prosthecobacter vanneervenii]|uniref:Uncharacterized protein n=1 Tax=Prosthecobacter vanneervenii TaxID=48466 RepID=A0A7W8DIB7_9BACT|nr:hypothetical protein [Prosthecobacter vanneervenii]MBB5030858.1 hypothetical protein [Prosthecobacter vanneervenii]
MLSTTLPSASQLKQALKLALKLEAAQSELASILGGSSDTASKGPGRPRKKRSMSEEGKKRIAEAQKKRWAAQKKSESSE